jgi:hypothetical protein
MDRADETRRSALIARVWAPDGTLVDPPMTAFGHGERTAVTATFRLSSRATAS